MPSNVSLHRLKQEPRLVSITASHMSRDMRDMVASRVIPALLTRMLIGPAPSPISFTAFSQAA